MIEDLGNGLTHEIDSDGIEFWCLNGELHREGAPAVVVPGMEEHWFLHGKQHRIGAPAFSDTAGNEEWWENGKLHRLDGPASNVFGKYEWWIDGKKIRHQSTYQQLTGLSEEEMTLLILKYGGFKNETKNKPKHRA